MAPLYKSAIFLKVWNYICSNIAKSCRNIALVFIQRVGIGQPNFLGVLVSNPTIEFDPKPNCLPV